MGTPNSTPERPAAARTRHRLFAAAACLAGLLPLLLLELGLRWFDVVRPADQPDPFAGFNRHFPVFERQGNTYRTARAREPFLAPQEFPATKPPGSLRVFCFGGSTVYGHPYLGDTAFPKWLELELAATAGGRASQVINCGGISYASYRIAPMVQEVLHHQPDLIVIATGHNEFLEDRTYRDLKSRFAPWAWLQSQAQGLRLYQFARRCLPGAAQPAAPAPAGGNADESIGPVVNARLDNASGYASYHRDEAWRDSVVAQYDESLRTMVAACQAARVPVVLVRLGSNLRDCPPFKSEHRRGLAPETEADWQAAFDLATEAERADPNRSLQLYREAAAIDGQHALLNYRLGRLLDRLGRPAEALPFFERARDEDICPLRLIGPVERALTRVATDTSTPLVDAAGLIAGRCPDGIAGNDWYLDHVHPTIRGHQLIAHAVASTLREKNLLSPGPEWPEAQRREAYARHLGSLAASYFPDGERRVAWLDKWSQRQRLAEEMKPYDARSWARLAFRQLDLGQEESARAAISEALRRDPGVASLIRQHAAELAAGGLASRAAVLSDQRP